MTDVSTPKRVLVFGPEPWATLAGASWSHWDRWLAAVAVADYGGCAERLVDELYAHKHPYRSDGDIEAKASHVSDLVERLADRGLALDDLAAEAINDKPLLRKARRKVLDQALTSRDLTPAMRDKPSHRLRARALRGWWDRFPVSPVRADRVFAKEVNKRDYYTERGSLGLSTRLERLRGKAEATAASDAELLAVNRAMLTVAVEALDRTDDSYGAFGDFIGEVLTGYVALPWVRKGLRAGEGMDAEVYYADLCGWLVWTDTYAVAFEKEMAIFAHVAPAHVELVERLLGDLEAELHGYRLAYQANAAAELVAWLHAATGSFERGVEAARRLGSNHWRPIVGLAEAAIAAGRRDLALAVFSAADQPGPRQDRLRQRCVQLLGELPPKAARLVLADYEAEHGEITEQELDDVRAQWPD